MREDKHMFHKLGLRNDFDLPSELFIKNLPKVLIVQQASVIRGNSIGPETGSAVGFNKNETMIKAASEAIERRSSMIGPLNISTVDDTKVETWNLVKKCKDILDVKYTRLYKNITDTTGTAIHIKSSYAIQNAIKELFEKNALFLFWYGKIGNRIEEKYYFKNKYYKFLSESGFQVSVFINNYFNPLNTLIVMVYKEEDLFLCGLGTNTNPFIALDHAFEEAYLIGYMQYYAILGGHQADKNLSWSKEKINHLKKLNTIDMLELNSIRYGEFNLNNFIQDLPNFVDELHLIFLEQFLNNKLKCVRVYSKDLINCLPLKKNIDLNVTINQNTIQLNKRDLENHPECPMC